MAALCHPCEVVVGGLGRVVVGADEVVGADVVCYGVDLRFDCGDERWIDGIVSALALVVEIEDLDAVSGCRP